MRRLLIIFCALSCLVACKQQERKADNPAFARESHAVDSLSNDLEALKKRNGELIVGVVTGPQTYFEYHGMPMGVQYALVSQFAADEGLGVRVEVCLDSLELGEKLSKSEVDVSLSADGPKSWGVRSDAPQLAEALKKWSAEEKTVAKVIEDEKQRFANRGTVQRKVHAPFLDRSAGIISEYDNLFKEASSITGWDWRIIAAQCYRESAFDPFARSWAGAQGLMQLMPKTAASMGVPADQINNPGANVRGAAKYIARLTKQFGDISNPQERIKFVLGAYNGGPGHIRDAMALARKYGRNPQSWQEVSVFVLGLMQPQYYRDPVVKCGYMVGTETTNYVVNIFSRAQQYGANVTRIAPPSAVPVTVDTTGVRSKPQDPKPQTSHSKNRFTRNNATVQRPEDLEE